MKNNKINKFKEQKKNKNMKLISIDSKLLNGTCMRSQEAQAKIEFSKYMILKQNRKGMLVNSSSNLIFINFFKFCKKK